MFRVLILKRHCENCALFWHAERVSEARPLGRASYDSDRVVRKQPLLMRGLPTLSMAAQEPNLKTEAIAGITTFFTMAYIVIVNPQILSAGGKTGMAFTGVLTATVLVCFTM